MPWETTEVVVERINRRWALHPEEARRLKEMGELYRKEEDPYCFLYESLACTYGLGGEPRRSNEKLAREYGMPIKKVHFYRKVALWILGEERSSKNFMSQNVAAAAERIQLLYSQRQKETEREVKGMPKLGEIVKIIPAKPKKKEKKVLLAPKEVELFEAFMVEAEQKLDGTYEVSSLSRIAEEMGMKNVSPYIAELKKKGLLGLKEMKSYPGGKGRYGIYWIKMVDVAVKPQRPQRKPRARPTKKVVKKASQLQIPSDALATLVKWLEKEISEEEKKMAVSEERLRRLRVTRDLLCTLIESPIFKGGGGSS